MSTPAERLLAAQRRAHAANFAPRQERAALTIVTVQRDSLGNPVAAHGTIRGEGDFTMPAGGLVLEVGQVVEVGYPVGTEAGAPLEYLRHLSSDYPGTGAIGVNNPVPPPEFAAVPFTADIKTSETSVAVYVTAWFKPVAAKELPSGYLISYRFTAPGQARTDWTDQGPVPPLTSNPFPVALATPFPPGSTVDVKARTLTSRAAVPSEEGEVESFICPSDTGSPGTVSGFLADNSVRGDLKLSAVIATIDTARFNGIQWEVANSSGGAGLTTAFVQGEYHYRGTPGPKWVALRLVAKSGVLGPRYPGSTGFAASPVDLLPTVGPPDLIAPPVFGAPTLGTRAPVDHKGTLLYFLSVTLPAYTFPGDYAYTEVSMSDGVHPPSLGIIAGTGTTGEWQVEPGTWTVALRGVDTYGNRQATFGTSASITIAPIGAPAVMAPPTVTQKGGALLITWTFPAGATWVEVERSDDAAGSGAVSLGIFDTTMYLDFLLTPTSTPTLPTYYYRVRGVNLDTAGAIRNGTYSTRTAGSLLALHGSFLIADSITAREIVGDQAFFNEVMAGKILSSVIQTAATGSTRVQMSGINNRFEVYNGAALQAFLDGTRLQVINTGTGLAKLDLNGTGLYVYTNAGILKVQLDTNGLTVYNNSGATVLFTGEQAGVGYVASTGGFTMFGDMTQQDFSGVGKMRFLWVQAADELQDMYFTSIRSGGTRIGFGMAGYRRTPGGIVGGNFYFVNTTDPLNATTNLSSDYTQITGGVIAMTGNLSVGGQYIVLGPSNYLLRGNPGVGFDVNTAIRSANADGSAVKFFHSGTAGNFHADWSHGAGYLGWFANPAVAVHVGNGAAGYGPIYASAFTVSSDRAQKENITDLGAAGGLLDALRPRRYRRIGDPPDTERIGLIADEVTSAGLPVLVYPSQQVPDGEPVPDGDPIDTGERTGNDEPIMTQPMRQAYKDSGQAVDTYGLLTVAIAALKETRSDFRAFRQQATQRMTALEARVAALEARG
jgi:hypothetical protein